MPVTKKKSNTKPTDSERLQLVTVVSQIEVAKTAFAAAVANAEQWQAETIMSLDANIHEKSLQLKELETQLVVAKKDCDIDLKQYIREKQRAAALEFLGKTGEVAVNAGTLEALQAEVTTLKETHAKELTALEARMRKKSEADMAAALSNQDLKHAAEKAQNEAKVEQQTETIKRLEAVVADHRSEMDKQRKLTQQVAEAGSKGAINQTIAK